MACWSRHRIFGRRSLRQDRRSGFCVWCNLLAWAHLLRRSTVSHQITFAWRRILFHQIIWFYSTQRTFLIAVHFRSTLHFITGRDGRSEDGDVGESGDLMVEMVEIWWWSLKRHNLPPRNGKRSSDIWWVWSPSTLHSDVSAISFEISSPIIISPVAATAHISCEFWLIM